MSSAKKKIGGGGAPNASKSKLTASFTVSPDASPDCKRAVEVCLEISRECYFFCLCLKS